MRPIHTAKETYYSKKKNRTEAHHVERELLKQVQVTGKRDLLYGKRDLLYGKRDLLYGKRDLLYGKRDLLFGKRDLYGKRDLLYGERDLLLPTSFTTASSSS